MADLREWEKQTILRCFVAGKSCNLKTASAVADWLTAVK